MNSNHPMATPPPSHAVCDGASGGATETGGREGEPDPCGVCPECKQRKPRLTRPAGTTGTCTGGQAQIRLPGLQRCVSFQTHAASNPNPKRSKPPGYAQATWQILALVWVAAALCLLLLLQAFVLQQQLKLSSVPRVAICLSLPIPQLAHPSAIGSLPLKEPLTLVLLLPWTEVWGTLACMVRGTLDGDSSPFSSSSTEYLQAGAA